MELSWLKRFQFLLAVSWCFVGTEVPAEAQNILCYENFDAVTGACRDLLGEAIPKEDCCLNHQYGFQAHKDGHCQACHKARWSEWSPWSACSVSCTEGVQRRSRTCYGQPEGLCTSGSREWEMQHCSLRDCCPVMGGLSEWSSWTPCSVTCRSGIQLRERSCTNPAPACGGTCLGESKETRPCDTKQVCPTHGNWGSWGPWGDCSMTCTLEGSAAKPQQQRHRLCNSPSPSSSPQGNPCPGASRESRSCTGVPFCPVDGSWGSWKAFQHCSVTCGVGRTVEKRLCDHPAPKHGGKNCPGQDTRNHACFSKVPCPVDGLWAEWSSWSSCTRPGIDFNIKCEEVTGIQSKTRKCIGRAHGGRSCRGPFNEARSCYSLEGCFMKGTWTEWSPWGLCEPPCGPEPKRSRRRLCIPIYPNYPMTMEAESGKTLNVTFWGKPRILCEALDGQRKEVVEELPCQNVPPCEG